MKRVLFFNFLIGFSLSITSGFAATSTSIHLPDFQQLSLYSPQARADYLKKFQAVLLRMDARPSSETSRIDGIWESFIYSSFAADNVDVPFCVNRGVVLKVGDANCATGPKMHDFDTSVAMQSYNMGAAVSCPGGGQPCSPIFGFTAQGNVNCTSQNSTPACEEESGAKGERSLASIIQACANSKNTDPVKVNCPGLKSFFNDETKLVQANCNAENSPVCGALVLTQIQKVTSDAKAAPSPADVKSPLSPGDANTVVSFVSDATRSAAQTVAPPTAYCPPPIITRKAPTRKTAALSEATAADKWPKACDRIINPDGSLGAWGRYLETVLQSYQPNPDQSKMSKQDKENAILFNGQIKDLSTYCPGFSEMDSQEQVKFWIYFVASDTIPESHCDQNILPHKTGIDGNTAVGLLQLAQGKESEWGCPKNMDDTDPEQNLSCGLHIMIGDFNRNHTLFTKEGRKKEKNYFESLQTGPKGDQVRSYLKDYAPCLSVDAESIAPAQPQTPASQL